MEEKEKEESADAKMAFNMKGKRNRGNEVKNSEKSAVRVETTPITAQLPPARSHIRVKSS